MILEIMGTNYLRGVVSSCNLSENTPPPATLGCNNNHTTTGGVSTDTRHKKGGFTLVELSIVLIIIGLIVGGVLGGQSLIKSAELQRVVNDTRQYATAVAAFRLEYNALPGDMDNAQDYWTSCVDKTDNPCNGNGNGVLDNTWTEAIRLWQHMSLAGIVPGNYRGYMETGDLTSEIGVVIPGSNYQGGGYFIGANSNALFVNFGSVADISKFYGTLGVNGGILSAKNSKAIDVKMDDGVAWRGKLGASKGFNNPATSANDLLSGCNDASCNVKGSECYTAKFGDGNADKYAMRYGDYALSDSSPHCLIFYQPF